MYHIIINPVSRSGKGLQIWKKQIEPALHAEKVRYRSYFSAKEGDVTQLTKSILSSVKDRPVFLILLGGDGTMNEALQGIADPSDVVLGYIPTGSSNDLARALRLPSDPAEALRVILHTGRRQSMDLGTVVYQDGTKRLFAVSCGIGFDAAVCEEALHSRLKNALNRLGLGKLTYLGIALKQLLTARAVSCKLFLDDNAPIDIRKILFVTCMLHPFEGGGFMFCPNADATDGILDLCVVGDLSKFLILLALPTAFWGKHYFVKGITPYRARKVRLETSSPLWVHTDGEVTRKTTSFSVSCGQNRVEIIGI